MRSETSVSFSVHHSVQGVGVFGRISASECRVSRMYMVCTIRYPFNMFAVVSVAIEWCQVCHVLCFVVHFRDTC